MKDGKVSKQKKLELTKQTVRTLRVRSGVQTGFAGITSIVLCSTNCPHSGGGGGGASDTCC